MARLCVLDVVGLTPSLLRHAPRLAALGPARPWQSPLPAVTSTCQATLLTGLPPSRHGIVANGWLYRDTGEVRFWQQSDALVQGPKLGAGLRVAKLFWWFNQGSSAEWYATPKPHYGCDGSKVFDVIDATGCDLEKHLGRFPFSAFWGPRAGLEATRWIAAAAARVLVRQRPDLTLVYLPHLDYDQQRFGPGNPERAAEVDRCAGVVIDAAESIGARVVALSEYGIVPVSRPVLLNRVLRRAGWLAVRDGPFGEMLDTHGSRAFAVVDHQLAHVYVRDLPLPEVRALLEAQEGVAAALSPADLELDHGRAGELVALSEPDAWFAYPYWLDPARAPDFARTVDIHRKPGFDPCELFATSRLRAAARLAQKALGFRYRMDVVPLEPERVRGSHGLRPEPGHGPLVIGPDPPGDMRDFKAWAERLLEASPTPVGS
jgi:predicted AlkP superfamily pyrophosphatase or phosphodiesterase